MASSLAISTASNLPQVRILVVSSRPRISDYGFGRICRWPRQREMVRRNLLLAKCSSASRSDFTSSEETLVKNEDGGAKEIRENVFLKNAIVHFEEAMNSFPPMIPLMKGIGGQRLAIGVFLAVTAVLVLAREIVNRRSRSNPQGSVADLVRRGQLKSHKRGISAPLHYDDPFNNPFVKYNSTKSSVEMCGKVYSLAPLTLTPEQRSTHQRRRSRAYEWKRPTVFLKEGDPLPAGVDPETVRWIPSNHPFATTSFDLDEDLARSNVQLQSGIPYRVRAEHEALQKKLEAQGAQRTNQRQNLSEEWNPSQDAEPRQNVDRSYPSQNADLASDSSNNGTMRE